MKKKKYIKAIVIPACMAVLLGILMIPFGVSAQQTGNAYAVLDGEGNLTFFRSESTYQNNTTGTFTDVKGDSYSGRVFAGFENNSGVGLGNCAWRGYAGDINKVSMAQDISPVDTSWWFYNCTNLREAHLSKLITPNTTAMDGMFEGCSSLEKIDIRNVSSEQIKSMDGMLYGLDSLVRICLGENFRFDKKAKDEVQPELPEAYAVFDSADGSLTFFRDEDGKYTNGQTDGTKTYYTGVETTKTMTSSIPWYSQGENVTSVVFEDAIKPAQTYGWFYYMQNLASITGLEKLDTSNVTSMYGMFAYCYDLTSLDLSHFDTSNVTSMNQMFSECQSLTTLDVSHFDTSNVTRMYKMFYNCQNLTTLDVSHFDTSKVTTMSYMFNDCQNLTSLDVSHFDTSKVTNMGSMFGDCRSLTTLDLSHFDTSNVTDMGYMFGDCYGLTSLDVSHFDTSNVTDISFMFIHCQNLTTTLNIMKMPTSYTGMCYNAATQSGAQITLKYISPVTSANVDTLVATKTSDGNVVNGGQGTFVAPTPPEPPVPLQ